MKDLAARVSVLYKTNSGYGHPIDLTTTVEPQYLKAAEQLSANLPEPIPTLCSLVTASPFDCALHDAYGRLHSRGASPRRR